MHVQSAYILQEPLYNELEGIELSLRAMASLSDGAINDEVMISRRALEHVFHQTSQTLQKVLASVPYKQIYTERP